MAYSFRYKLQTAPRARQDGCGCVGHEIYAESSRDGGPWAFVPGRKTIILVPASELQAVLAAGTNQQIIAAYKGALADNVGTQPVPVDGWGPTQLEALMDANDAATAAANAAHEFITGTLGLAYPVHFTI